MGIVSPAINHYRNLCRREMADVPHGMEINQDIAISIKWISEAVKNHDDKLN